jgi:hypothetical protein
MATYFFAAIVLGEHCSETYIPALHRRVFSTLVDGTRRYATSCLVYVTVLLSATQCSTSNTSYWADGKVINTLFTG